MSIATRASKKDGEKAKEADLACDQYNDLFKATKAVLHCEGSYHIHMHRYCAGASKYHSLPGNEQLYAVFVSYSGLLKLGSICFGQQNIDTFCTLYLCT